MDLNSVTQVSHLTAFGGSFEISIKKGIARAIFLEESMMVLETCCLAGMLFLPRWHVTRWIKIAKVFWKKKIAFTHTFSKLGKILFVQIK